MSNEWLKIKIIRDLGKIEKIKKLSISSISYNPISYEKKLREVFSPRYLNLLSLILNKWLYSSYNLSPGLNILATNDVITKKKINLSFLDSIDLDLIVDITKNDNVEIIAVPYFTYFIIKNNQIYNQTASVNNVRQINTLDHIKNHENYMFYIYQVERDNARWYMVEDNNLIRRRRKEKLEKIEISI